MINQASDGTFSFTHGTRTYTGYASREQAQEALYDVERGIEPAALALAEPDTTPAVRMMPDGTPNKYDTGEYNFAWSNVKTPIATLSNGAAVIGGYDVDGSRHCVSLTMGDGCFYAGDDGIVSGYWAGQNFEIDTAQLAALRVLFASDILPHLLAIAAAWEDRTPRQFGMRDDSELPTFTLPAAPAVRIDRQDDMPDPCTDYCCGDVTIEVLDDPSLGEPTIYDFGAKNGISIADAQRDIAHLNAILNDPRFQAAQQRQVDHVRQTIRCTTYA